MPKKAQEQEKKPLKPVSERIQESIELVQKMKEAGISENSVGFIETRQRLNDWIRKDEGWTGKINFAEYGRKGELVLPTLAGRISSMKLLAFK